MRVPALDTPIRAKPRARCVGAGPAMHRVRASRRRLCAESVVAEQETDALPGDVPGLDRVVAVVLAPARDVEQLSTQRLRDADREQGRVVRERPEITVRAGPVASEQEGADRQDGRIDRRHGAEPMQPACPTSHERERGFGSSPQAATYARAITPIPTSQSISGLLCSSLDARRVPATRARSAQRLRGAGRPAGMTVAVFDGRPEARR